MNQNDQDQDLRALLAELHLKLGEAHSVDEDSRALLAAVSADIEQALGRNPPPALPQSKLAELAARFEVEHPALAEAVRDVIDALGKAGI
jgi:septal ring factor EnvC (AmiA/AmiB activator)